jgi:peptide/nickel transport system substrate-binding protein
MKGKAQQMKTLNNRKRWRVVAVAAALAISASVLTACTSASSSSSSSSASNGTLTIAAPNGPLSLNPALNGGGTPLLWFTQLAYQSLIYRTPDGKAHPGLATSWGYSSDRLSFVLHLRKGVKFSDGTPLTADAVVAWLDYYKAKGTVAANLANVSDITATGPLEVTMKLSTPDPLLPYALDNQGETGFIASLAGTKNPSVLAQKSLGAGPYVYDSADSVTNSSYVYTKNPNYYDQSAIKYKKVVIKIISDDNSTLAALRSGQVDIAQGSATTAAAAKAAGLNVNSAEAAFVGVYLLDLAGKTNPAFKDVRVRQALNLAINRAAIVKTVYRGYGAPTDQITPKGQDGYVASLEKLYPYDPAKAKKLLTAAGYPNGISFSVVVQPGALQQGALAQVMVQQWAAAGIKVTLVSPTDFPTYVTDLESGKYAATTLNFYYLTQLTVFQGLVTLPATYNTNQYNDVKANQLATVQRKYDVGTAQGKAAAEASETYVAQNASLIPVAAVDSIMLSTKNVKGVAFTSAFPTPDPRWWSPAK